MRTKRVRFGIALLVILVFGALPLCAQFDTGTINGTVTDASGAVVPQAAITVTNTGTGIQRSFVTDQNGNFVASSVPFGTYVIAIHASGFADAKSQPVVLNVGATVQVNLKLAVAGAQESVQVNGTATTVDTFSSTSGTTLDANQVQNLPINGRDVSQFLEVSPGSVGSTGFFQGSVNGMENIFTGLNITLDGQSAMRGDINGFLDTEGQETARITRASVDSIQEIDYANSGYTAEVGHSLGPQMNIITKSGTNDFHGSIFEYFRNDALDALDYFETTKQPLRLNQFGGNLAGPLIKNKVFFFVNYEGDRTHITIQRPLNHTLSAYARSQFSAPMQPVLAQFAPLPAACSAIYIDPLSACAYPGFTDPNPANGSDMVYDPASLPNIVREDTGSVRIDYNVSEKDRVFFRYNINDSLTNYTYGLNQGQVSPQKLRTQYAKVDETHIFSSTLLNDFSVAINRFYSDTNSNTPTPLVTFAGFFTDLGSLPGANTFNQVTPFADVEIFDNVSKTIGRQTLKFGTQIRINRNNEWLRPQQTYDYASIHDLQIDDINNGGGVFVLQKIGFPGFVNNRNSNWDFYVQDDWKVNNKLTLNLGLRYDYNTVWATGPNQGQNFDIATQAFLPANQAPYSAPKGDWAPRIGLAFDPTGKGKTVIHAYGGLFYNPMHFNYATTTNVPALASYNVNVFQAIFADPPFSIDYPAPNPPLIAGTQNVNAFPQHPKDPVAGSWLFGIQQEVARGTIVTVNYVGNNVHHMQSGVDFAALNANPANVFTQARQYSGFANENILADGLSSNYNALQVRVARRAGKLNLEANYTWSHQIDDVPNVFSPGFESPYTPIFDRSSGDPDVRHNLTGSAVYSFPDLKGSSSFVQKVLGGWQTSGILQTRSGLPTNITLVSGFFGNPVRPDYVPGQPLWVANHSWPHSSYNIDAFAIEPTYDGTPGATIGTVGRNALRGPAYFQLDLSGMKNLAITKRVTMQFRADIFNIFNHPNFTNPDGGICQSIGPGTCTPNPFFGVVGQTIADADGTQIGGGTSRQTQFSLRFTF
ncbi:MAG TPA: carboxypeptidase regulatory-like domain-containing protein [Terriglobales bacterium]|nr:carboxypeptidase regulatory-like domain-containing protein [Terriglobales bacterium]